MMPDTSQTEPIFELLANSQTLLGVLLTLAVLCVFSQKSSNYILTIWISQSKKSTVALNGLLIKLKERIRELNENRDVVILNRIITGEISCEDSHRKDANRILFNLRLIQRSDNVSFNELKLKTVGLAKYNEQYVAPLYSFVFGLIVFIADEICRVTHSIPEWCIFGLYQFTILSCIFFILIWGVFLNHPMKDRGWLSRLRKPGRWCKEKIGPLCTSVLVLLGCVVVADGLLLSINFTGLSEGKIRWIVILCLAGPITLAGILKLLLSKAKGDYSTHQILGHLLALLSLAALFTASIYLIGQIQTLQPKMVAITASFSNLEVLRFMIVMFVLLNAVIFPLFIPLIKLGIIKRPYSKDLRKRINDAEEFSKYLKEEMPRLCHDILCAGGKTE